MSDSKDVTKGVTEVNKTRLTEQKLATLNEFIFLA